jgi:hypothetical protein
MTDEFAVVIQRTQMSDLTFALRHSALVYNDLNEHCPLTIDALRATYRQRHPTEKRRFKQWQWVIEAVATTYPDILRQTLADINRPEKGIRRQSSPLEKVKGRTHGFEYAGQVSGGNFGALF